MTDAKQPDALELASVAESADLAGYPTAKKANAYYLCLLEDCAQMIRRLHAENETLRAELETLREKLKTYEDLGDAGSDVQLLRMGYAAARLEIESLRKEHADEPAVAYMCGASREKEIAAQQPGAAGLIGALEDAQRAINSMKVEAETAAQGDALSDAVRVPLDSLHADAAYLIGRLREDSMPYDRVIEIIRERIDAAKAAIRARAAQGDALDAARYRFLRDGEWRDTDLEPFIRLQLNTLWDAKIDAARAAQEDKSHE